ncbi:MAG: RNA polymerase sigma factor [Cyclobacteriaceae bacterium]
MSTQQFSFSPASNADSSGAHNQSKSYFEKQTDQEIWRLFVDGDNKAFIYLYDKYFITLFRYGCQLTADKELIKDVIQDIFIDFRVKKYNVSSTTSIRFYLLRCFKNNLINKLKKNNRYLIIGENIENFDFTFSLSQEQILIDRQLKDETIKKLNEALKKLTNRQREAMYYLFYQNFSIDQIQKMMQMENRRSVQNLIYKTISILKDQIVLIVTYLFYPI